MRMMGGDEIDPFNITSDEWDRMVRTAGLSTEYVQKWEDVTPEKILADLRDARKAVEEAKNAKVTGVIVFAGRNAFATLRKMFPEDTDLVKILERTRLGEDQCVVVKEENYMRENTALGAETG